MLRIINELSPFFDDCYRRISVREYSKIIGVSPPTASKILNNYLNEGLLLRDDDRNYQFYYANKSNNTFIVLSRIYWSSKLNGIVEFLVNELLDPTIILFGSLSKAETTKDSDIDLAVISSSSKNLEISSFEKSQGRKIQLFYYKSLDGFKSKELLNNVVNGHVLAGRLRS